MSDIKCFKFTPYKPVFLSSGSILESLESLQISRPILYPRPLQKEFLGMENTHQYFFLISSGEPDAWWQLRTTFLDLMIGLWGSFIGFKKYECEDQEKAHGINHSWCCECLLEDCPYCEFSFYSFLLWKKP